MCAFVTPNKRLLTYLLIPVTSSPTMSVGVSDDWHAFTWLASWQSAAVLPVCPCHSPKSTSPTCNCVHPRENLREDATRTLLPWNSDFIPPKTLQLRCCGSVTRLTPMPQGPLQENMTSSTKPEVHNETSRFFGWSKNGKIVIARQPFAQGDEIWNGDA